EALHESRLQADVLVGRDDCHGERSEREYQERKYGGDEHGLRVLFLRIAEFVGVYGVYFDSGEQQYDAGQEGDVAESGHVREEPRMGMAGRYGSDFRYVGREVFEGEGIAADNPYQRHDDDDDARQ